MVNCLRTRNGQKRRRGAALVEMALVSPLLITLLLGIIEFGRAFAVGQLAASAVRDAARYATNEDVTSAQVTAVVQSHIATSTGINGDDVLVIITVEKSGGGTSSDLTTATSNDMVTVQAEIAFNSVGYITGNFLKDKNVVAKCAMWHK